MSGANPATPIHRRAAIAVGVIIVSSLFFIIGVALGAPPALLVLSEGVSLALLLWFLFARPSAAPLPTRPPVGWSSEPAERVDQLLGRIERLAIDELRLLAVRPADDDAHESAREAALQAAREAHLDELVGDTEVAIEGFVDRAMGTRSFDPTFVGLAWRHEPTGPADRIRLIRTLSDAALAVAVRDLVDDGVADELLGPLAGVVEPDGPEAASV